MARMYLPPSTPPAEEPKAKPAEATQPESTPQGSVERTVKLAEPAASASPPANASKADWVDYAVTYRAADKDEAEAMTRNVLAEKYGRPSEGD